MRLNTIIEEDYGRGECHHKSTPTTGPTALAFHVTTTGASDDGVRDTSAALRINHAHEELMGMGDHSIS